MPSRKVRYLRSPDGWRRRIADASGSAAFDASSGRSLAHPRRIWTAQTQEARIQVCRPRAIRTSTHYLTRRSNGLNNWAKLEREEDGMGSLAGRIVQPARSGCFPLLVKRQSETWPEIEQRVVWVARNKSFGAYLRTRDSRGSSRRSPSV